MYKLNVDLLDISAKIYNSIIDQSDYPKAKEGASECLPFGLSSPASRPQFLYSDFLSFH